MADKIQGITVEIGGDTTGLSNALKDINKESNNLSKELKDVEKLLKLDPTNTELLAQKQELLAKQAETAAKRVDAVHQAQDEFNKMVAEGKIEKGTEEYRKFEREVASAEASLKKAKDAQEDFGKQHSAVSKVKDAVAGVKEKLDELKDSKFGQAVSAGFDAIKGAAKATVEAVAAVGAKVIEFSTSAISAGQEFDASMSQVSAVSGATGDDFDALREKALEMGSKTKFSASEAADAMNYMAMAGWKTEDMLSGIEGIMSLAAASGENLATTSDIVTDALTAFGLKAEDSGHFADVLAAASANANTNVSMLGESFKYVAPLAGALGYSAEDVAIALGTMANAGVKGSQAGTSLKTALANLANPSQKMIDMMAQLGLVTEETVSHIDGLKLEKAQTKVANNTNAMEKAQISYNAAVEKYGAESDQAAKAALSLSTAQNNLTLAQSELDNVMQGETETILGQNLALTDEDGNMRSLGDTLSILRESFAGLTETEKAEAAATIFGKEAMAGMLSIINASDEDFAKLTESIYDADGAAENMAATMQDNLAGDLTILQSALEGAKITLSDALTPTLREFVQYGTEAISTLTEAFKDGGLSGAMDALSQLLGEGLSMIQDELPVFVEAAVELIAALFGAALEAIGEALPMISETLTEYLPQLTQTILSFLPTILEVGLQLFLALIGALPEIIKQICAAIPEIITAIVDVLLSDDMISQIIEAGVELLISLVENLPKIIKAIVAAIPKIITALVKAFADNKDKIKEVGSDLIKGLVQGIQDMASWVKDKISGFFGGVVDSIKDFFGIHSPSKLFRDEIGKMLALGVGEGFEEEMKDVREDMKDAIPTSFDTEVNTAFGAINGSVGDVFDVTIPFMIGAEKITTAVSRIQYSRQAGQARVLGVSIA